MEDYKEKYEQALEKAKICYKDLSNLDGVVATMSKDFFEEVFPELKESEDEKIRKELLKIAKESEDSFYMVMTPSKRESLISWLEKQGEQKPEEVDNLHNYLYDEQKPTDKVEPKFKVGDWVVYNRNDSSREIIQVYDIRDGRYYFTDNVHFSWSIKECDEKAHLWTINDAKDGDVLANENGSPFIFNGFLERTTVGTHCGVTGGIFCIPRNKNNWTTRNALPATKEQRDLLLSKMKEAGYEWDAKKKELKKIEQKPAWGEEEGLDETKQECGSIDVSSSIKTARIKTLENILSYFTYERKTTQEEINTSFIPCLENLLKDIENTNDHASWSEEDSVHLTNAILAAEKEWGTESYTSKWLKSIKERIQPQPKQEWSEEDEQYFISILGDIGIADKNMNEETYQRKRKWLENKFKSLKERYTWKPSDEQIDILEQWLRDNRYNGDARYCYPIVDSLYQDLKKLRKE